MRTVRLTAAGVAEWAVLDRSSEELAASILDPLSVAQRDRLVVAMADVERLLLASQVDIAVTDPRRADARSCLRAYFDELASRFESGFDPARSISASDEEMTPPRGLLLVAAANGVPVGCGALKLHPEAATAEVKRLWTAPDARGLGIGRRLLARLEQEAMDRGITTLRLETNRALVEAIAMYAHAGFRRVEAFNDEPCAHHWFEKSL